MDHYSTLGVEPTATLEEIKVAYRQAALKHHPDKNLGDLQAETRFKAVKTAYDILSNGLKRSEYDRKRPKPLRPVKTPTPEYEPIPVHRAEGMPFGGGTTGRNILAHLKLPKSIMKEGGRPYVRFSRKAPCAICLSEGEVRVNCTSCGGFRPNDATGHNHNVMWCRYCEGDGYRYVACSKCDGTGIGNVDIAAEVIVTVPPNSATGNSVIVHGEGEHAPKKPPGYLKVVLIEE
jgi:molecular chaperone DnaJ